MGRARRYSRFFSSLFTILILLVSFLFPDFCGILPMGGIFPSSFSFLFLFALITFSPLLPQPSLFFKGEGGTGQGWTGLESFLFFALLLGDNMDENVWCKESITSDGKMH
jgi:hypothetical protein